MTQTRRQLLGSLLAGAAIVSGSTAIARATPAAQLPMVDDQPAGGFKAGPLGVVAGDESLRQTGQLPIAIVIPQADVDAEVERTKIVEGQMLDPSGPWIVGWYEGTGLAGEIGPDSYNNCLMSGHVDYWDVGPAVFRNVINVPEGGEITLYGEDNGEFVYAVEWVERIDLRNLPEGKIQEITGPTDYGALTLVTCGGEFDYEAGEYLQRDIIRARLADDDATSDDAQAENTTPEEPAIDGLAEDGQATIVETVNIRAGATTNAEVVNVAEPGTVVTITGDSEEADGYTWWPVTIDTGISGWTVEAYLEPGG